MDLGRLQGSSGVPHGSGGDSIARLWGGVSGVEPVRQAQGMREDTLDSGPRNQYAIVLRTDMLVWHQHLYLC